MKFIARVDKGIVVCICDWKSSAQLLNPGLQIARPIK